MTHVCVQRNSKAMANQSADGDVYTLESVVRGHHIYKCIWTPRVGEHLLLKLEESNNNDPRAVAIVKESIVVGQRLEVAKETHTAVTTRLDNINELTIT